MTRKAERISALFVKKPISHIQRSILILKQNMQMPEELMGSH